MKYIDKKLIIENMQVYTYNSYFILEWQYFTGCPNYYKNDLNLEKDKFADAILKELERPKEKEIMKMI